jgi:3-methyl-2-oxobutanoate hydroxymethyltransferase
MIWEQKERNKMGKNLAYLKAKKDQHEPIVMVTCYDYPTAQIEDEAGVDIIFVGDSVGTNILGYAAETEVTMEDMLHHLKAVRRGVQEAYLLVDLPHGAYQTPEMALVHAQRLLAHGPNGVKLEGGIEQVEVVRTLSDQGIEVCGHLGFTPQTMGTKGRVQGRSLAEGKALLRSALALEAAGLSLLVLELVSEPISQLITQHLRIPTIGIGAGRLCDGQVLVITDILGISPMERKLFKRYEHWRKRSLEAVHRYKYEVQRRIFPAEANTFTRISEEEAAALARWMDQGMPPETE